MTSKVLHYQKLGEFLRQNQSKPAWAMASVRRLLTPWETDRLKFAFNDPKEFNTEGSVNPATFVKVLDQLEGRGNLSDESLIKLIDVFSSKCNRTEWKEFYQPVLQRAPDHGLAFSIANEWLADDQLVRPFEVQELQMGFPQGPGHFYPWEEEWLLRLIIVWGEFVESVGDDFTHWDAFNCERDFGVFTKQDGIKYPLVFEGITDGDDIMMTDMFEINQIDVWPGKMRRQLLEDAFDYISENSECRNISLGEGFPGDQNTDLSMIQKHFSDLGYDRLDTVLFKPAESTYTSPALLVPIHSADGVDDEVVAT